MDNKSLGFIARQIRKDILMMTTNANSGHPNSSLSVADILTVLYFHKMKHNPKNPEWPERDRFILSKGHACPALYACLARSGYFKVDELRSLRKINSILQGHPCKISTVGVEISTGSLGQGLSVGNGMALAGKLDGKDYRIYVLLGDGELQEGQVWEAVMTSSHYRLDNITAIIDYNNLQMEGKISDVMEIMPIADKFRSFGWHVIEIDGHSLSEITNALDNAEKIKEKPTLIIAKTVKGKGVSFMENKVEYNGKVLTNEELENALNELG